MGKTSIKKGLSNCIINATIWNLEKSELHAKSMVPYFKPIIYIYYLNLSKYI